MKPFAVLILAAGFSRRMGQFKPLLTISGETIIDHLIVTFLTSKVEVHVVVGYRGQELIKALKNREVTFVENTDYAHGMFTSVQAGVRALKPGYEAFFVMPVDIPLVKTSSIQCLQKAYSEHPGKIIYPVFRTKRGHPPLIPMSLAPVIAEWTQDGSLRAVLSAHERLAIEVDINDENIVKDIDNVDDYHSLLESSHVKSQQ
ncbi:MAG TPA: nucleotidyltransferase family protein [Dehalococcoidales bacterium]